MMGESEIDKNTPNKNEGSNATTKNNENDYKNSNNEGKGLASTNINENTPNEIENEGNGCASKNKARIESKSILDFLNADQDLMQLSDKDSSYDEDSNHDDSYDNDESKLEKQKRGKFSSEDEEMEERKLSR